MKQRSEGKGCFTLCPTRGRHNAEEWPGVCRVSPDCCQTIPSTAFWPSPEGAPLRSKPRRCRHLIYCATVWQRPKLDEALFITQSRSSSGRLVCRVQSASSSAVGPKGPSTPSSSLQDGRPVGPRAGTSAPFWPGGEPFLAPRSLLQLKTKCRRSLAFYSSLNVWGN